MPIFKKEYQVKPNQLGFLYRDNVLEQTLQPGRYRVQDWQNRTELVSLPTTSKLMTVTNQEVLTKDNVALRFSFLLVTKSRMERRSCVSSTYTDHFFRCRPKPSSGWPTSLSWRCANELRLSRANR